MALTTEALSLCSNRVAQLGTWPHERPIHLLANAELSPAKNGLGGSLELDTLTESTRSSRAGQSSKRIISLRKLVELRVPFKWSLVMKTQTLPALVITALLFPTLAFSTQESGQTSPSQAEQPAVNIQQFDKQMVQAQESMKKM
jgi:hypothetical protein